MIRYIVPILITAVILSAPAQEREIEELVVTARKQEETLQEVPLSVSAFSEEAIYQQGLVGLEDIASKTAGFSYEPYSTAGTSGYPVIRGLPNNFLTSRVQNVAFFIDGVYLQRSGMFDPGLTDVERVEIIKGPQSALYGRNAFAGAVNYITRKPGDSPRHQITVTAGSDERRDIKGMVSGPISETLSAKLSWGQTRYDGHTGNDHPLGGVSVPGPSTEDMLGGWDDSAFGASLHWQPSDALQLRLSVYSNDIEREVLPGYTLRGVGTDAFGVGIAANNNLNCHTITRPLLFNAAMPVTGNALWCGKLPLVSPTTNNISVDPRGIGALSETDVYTMNLDWDISDTARLHYIFGRVEFESETLSIADRNPVEGARIFDGTTIISGPPGQGPLVIPRFLSTNLFTSRPNSNLEADSHELRLEWGKENWQAMIGLYAYSVEDSEHNINYYAPTGSAAPISDRAQDSPLINSSISICVPVFPPNMAPPPMTPAACNPGVPGAIGGVNIYPLRGLVDSGDGTVPILNLADFDDEVSSVFGSYSYTINKSWEVSAEARYSTEKKKIRRFTDTLGRLVGADLTKDSETFSYFTPRLTVAWQSQARDLLVYGSVARGIKTGGFNATTSPSQLTYDEETNLTLELGVKSSWWDRRLQFNGAVYSIRWSDLQGQEADRTEGGQTTVVTGNIGDADNVGFEIEGSFAFSSQWWLDFGYSHNNPEYDDVMLQEVQNNLLIDNFAPIRCTAGTHAVCSADVDGNTLLRTSRNQAFAGLNFRYPMGDWVLWGRGDVSWQSKQYITALNLAHTGDRTLVNLSLGADINRISLHLWGKNVADEEYVGSSFYVSQLSQYVVATGPGASWGLTISYRYD